jgi:hypothetical protein
MAKTVDQDVVRGKAAVLDSGAKADPNAGSLWILPIGAGLMSLHWLANLPTFLTHSSPTADPTGFEQRSSSFFTVVITEYLFLLAGLILVLLGVIALADHLTAARARRWAVAGKALSVTAIALLLPIFALPLFVLPTLGDLYLSGHTEVLTVVGSFVAPLHGRVGHHASVMLLVVALAAIVMTVAIWRSRSFSRWVAILYGLAFALSMTAETPVISWTGQALLLAVGIRIALTARAHPIATSAIG